MSACCAATSVGASLPWTCGIGGLSHMSASACSPTSLIKSAGGEGSLVCLVQEGTQGSTNVSLMVVMEGEP
jgi:hypothetical protein